MPRPIKHGLSNTKIYRTWTSMVQRCHNPKDTQYIHYGARGISVCERWRASFMGFYGDMGPSYVEGMTIERLDNDLGYFPQNCTWISKRDQPKNRRMNVFIETPWGRMTLAEAGRQLGMSPCAFGRRYNIGWRGDKLFSPPVEKGARITPRVHVKQAR